jgi:cytochrome c553
MQARRLLPSLISLVAPACALAAARDKIEFFEKRIRPVLVNDCAECHGAKKQKGGLRLDSREALRRGGDTGPAVVPGDPAKSLLLTSIKHLDPDLQMPEKKPKLNATIIADFERWIADGAEDPRESAQTLEADSTAILDRAKKLWAFQPPRPVTPPNVQNDSWSPHPVDRFLQHAMEARDITPTKDADSYTLIRRLTYTLTGLPPTPREVEAFVECAAADRQAAVKAAADRLIASPHYGEHLARQWMDVVRYAETHGAENDDIIPEAWHFRDYIIRAFNSDVPFNQLIREHLAGDQIPSPRRHQGRNESVIGTAFLRFVEFNHAAVDVKREQATIVEDQLDALGKAFQGLTISCARCHDHKFDPVLQRDYYALYGIMTSARVLMQQLEEPAEFHREDDKLRQMKREMKTILARYWKQGLNLWPQQLADARAKLHASGDFKIETDPKAIPAGWLGVFRRPEANEVEHPLYPLARMSRVKIDDAGAFDAEWKKISARARAEDAKPCVASNSELIGDFTRGDLSGWFRSGALLPQPTTAGEFTLAVDGPSIVRTVQPAGYFSNVLSQRHGGSLRSKDFTLDCDRVRVLACGERDARMRLVIENFQGDSVLFASATRDLAVPTLRWFDINIRDAWKGCRAYIEFLTRDDKPYRGVVGKDQPGMHRDTDGRSAFGVVRVLKEKGSERSTVPLTLTSDFWRTPPATWDALIEYFIDEVQTALDAWSSDWCEDRHARLIGALVEAGIFDNQMADGHPAAQLVQACRQIEAKIPIAAHSPGVIDDPTALDAQLQLRGDWKLARETVPRAYLTALGGAPCGGNRSGRLALAKAIANPRNPLTARVYVNRVWQWLFGRGLVATPDNFGILGEAPSHPELLDFLANEFIAHGWSTKWLVRELVATRTWQLSAEPTADALAKDPANLLYSHAPVRRLTAEMIRDALLRVSGSLLEDSAGGPSIPVWLPDSLLDEYRPKPGPLDGGGHRSVYLEMRRNFPTDLLRVFDQPRPAASVGRRSQTTVPAQSLALLNDPFVRQQAQHWATKQTQPTELRLQQMYLAAFSRMPTESESERARHFIASSGEPNAVAWTELAHALFNTKEFIFLR